MRYKIELMAGALAAVALAAVVIVAISAPASAIPAFMRQTNMSCNQCHTSFGGPVPNFTITGKKFRSTGYRQVDVREQMESGEPGDQGERLKLPLLDYMSFRLQSVLVQSSKPTTGGKWSEAVTNPTTRLAIFWVGPIGDHLGIWNEWYFHTLGSRDQEWSLDLASWDEFDLKWSFNPENPRYRIELGISNMPIGDIMGFGPFPVFVGGLKDNRGEVQGLAHPNYGTAYLCGWMFDRWVWLVGGNTGDTNVGWERSNALGQLAYAVLNTNKDELWLRVVGRSGTDVLPLVTVNFVRDGARDWSYQDAVQGVTGTRPDGAGPYLAADVDKASTFEGEVRWERQDWGSSSFEIVGRGSYSKDDYKDGASTKYTAIGVDVLYTWRHTAYVMPYISKMTTYTFTDYTGATHDIDNSPSFGVWLAYKPTENFMLNLALSNTQTLHVDAPVDDKGRSVSLSIDFLL